MKQALFQARRSSLTLLFFAIVCSALLAGSYIFTSPKAKRNKLLAQQVLIKQALSLIDFDNNPAKSILVLNGVDAAMLGQRGKSNIFVAKKAGKVVAYVFEATAHNGYAGDINLLVGLKKDGHISGVRVVSHKETPGLGDYISNPKIKWTKQFEGKIWQGDASWKVKKDGGQFDYVTGATISARAVTGAVGRVLIYYKHNSEKLLQRSSLAYKANKKQIK